MATVEELESQLSAVRAELEKATGERDSALASATTAAADVAAAVGKYRDAVLAADPILSSVADLVSGGSVAEVEASAARARQIVGQVQAAVAAQGGGGSAAGGRPLPAGGSDRQPAAAGSAGAPATMAAVLEGKASSSELLRAGLAARTQ